MNQIDAEQQIAVRHAHERAACADDRRDGLDRLFCVIGPITPKP